jgi:hypothetical protein
VIVLQSSTVLVRVDPRHGGEIVDLVDTTTGRQLLGRPPFASADPLGGELDEDAWTGSYRGGWQTVTPNAGNACTHRGERHGFHGRASNDPWDMLDREPAQATLRWVGHGLEVTRQISVTDAVEVETEWVALDDAAFVAVEHLTVGTELLAPSATLRLSGGVAHELSEEHGPTTPPPEASTWPEVRLLSGATERADRIDCAEPSGRFFVVADVHEGRYDVTNEETGQGLRVAWDTATHPHLWVWREIRASAGRWRSQAEIVGLEPASVPHSLGLDRAAADGQAHVLRAGQRLRSWITASPFQTG